MNILILNIFVIIGMVSIDVMSYDAFMSDPLVIGIDPGFANCGFVVVELGATKEFDRVIAGTVICTKKADKKRRVRAADDNVERGREIARHVLKVVREFGANRFIAICAESMSFPRHSGNAAKMAMTWGIIQTVAEVHALPIMQASPQELKRAVTGNSMASKEEIIRKLSKTFGTVKLAPFVEDLAESKWEHLFDALGSIVACYETDTFRLARKMVRSVA